MKKQIVVIQPSLRVESYTDMICNLFIQECLKRDDMEVRLIDLRERKLEFCDGREIEEYNKDLQDDYEHVKYADILILGFPLYHFSVSGVLKNYLDIMRDSLQDKKIDFLVSAIFSQGEMSYEHMIESLHKKYNVTKASKITPYILNDMFRDGLLINMPARKQIRDFVASL
jgi:FMN reductase/FAD reductase [NAD(P)H]